MYSSEDLESFYFQYQTEAFPHGESLQSFCVKNKVPYNIFQKWFKDTRKKVVSVQIDGAPEISHSEKTRVVLNFSQYPKAVMTLLFVYGLTFVSAMGYIYSKRI